MMDGGWCVMADGRCEDWLEVCARGRCGISWEVCDCLWDAYECWCEMC